MNVELVREYRFEAAHRLPKVPPGHKCARLHGHSFKIELEVRGAVDEATGWFIDYGVLDERMRPILDRLDHHYLNEIEGLENPTSELLARWLWLQIAADVPALSAITVHETCDARCVYRGA
jgi:6-pyruvoyltetrahydropterin/6-carboxytetrahydropterin synthase